MILRFRIATVAVLTACVLGPPPVARAAPDGSDQPQAERDVFGHEKVWQFHLTLTAAEYEAMQPAAVGFPGVFPKGPVASPKVAPGAGAGKRETHRSAFGTEFPWAKAALTVEGTTIEPVGLRYKGNSTYLATARGLKRSFKVDLDRYDEGARFRGLKSLTLNCGVMDPTKSREALAYSVYRAAGVPAPRTAFAEVTLTVPGRYEKEFVGAYTLVEGVDKNFLKRNYKSDKGLLMKPERVRGLDHLGDDWARYRDTYQPKREAKPEEIARVIAFTKLVNQSPDDQFNKEIAAYLDIDAFLKYMAATAIVANLDSFFTLGHNYCLYLHPETNRFHFIPWDVDLSMGNFALFGNADQQMDLSLTKPYGGQSRLADRVMANKAFADRYQQIVRELVPVCFAKENLLAEIALLERVVKPLIEKEQKAVAARKDGAGVGPPGEFGSSPPDLKKFVEKRSESIAAQLAGKSKGFTPNAFGFGPPGGFAPPRPGDVLPAPTQNALQMSEAQRKELADLQKEVDARLEKILTPDQRSQLKRMREGPMGGFGPGAVPPPKPKNPLP